MSLTEAIPAPEADNEARTGSAEAFYSLPIATIRQETDAAISIEFAVPPQLRSTFAFKAGQHITLRAHVNGEELRRNYSACVAPHEGALRVAIKRVEGGRFSNWANDTLTKGDVVDVMPPQGRFTWSFNGAEAHRYLGIAGGSGITPVLSLAKTTLMAEPHSHFTLLYGNRHSGAIMFLDELADLKNRFMDRLSVYHFLEDEADEEAPLFNGRLDKDKLGSLIGGLIQPAQCDAVFICGPGPMMDAAEAVLVEAGLAKDRILIERFTAGRASAA
ncbi:MAG: FAD-binding oxidoreductase, partial [Pseudomonadota bacterium]